MYSFITALSRVTNIMSSSSSSSSSSYSSSSFHPSPPPPPFFLSNKPSVSPFDLPDEVLALVFEECGWEFTSSLERVNRAASAAVCRWWRTYVDDVDLWLWRKTQWTGFGSSVRRGNGRTNSDDTSNINSKQYWNYTSSKYYVLLSNYDRYDEVNPITQLSRQRYAQLYSKYPNVSYIPMYINDQLTKSDVPYPTKSPINNSQLRLNGQSRFNENSDLTQLVHFHKYNNIPLNGVHAYPFCLYPNEYQPSGSCNFSQLGDAYFILDTDDGEYNVGIIARNYNLLRVMGGQAGLAFEI